MFRRIFLGLYLGFFLVGWRFISVLLVVCSRMLNFFLRFFVLRFIVFWILDWRLFVMVSFRFDLFFSEFFRIMFWNVWLVFVVWRNCVKWLLGIGRFGRFLMRIRDFFRRDIIVGRMMLFRCICKFSRFKMVNKSVKKW